MGGRTKIAVGEVDFGKVKIKPKETKPREYFFSCRACSATQAITTTLPVGTAHNFNHTCSHCGRSRNYHRNV